MCRTKPYRFFVVVLFCNLLFHESPRLHAGELWPRHTIDASLHGADGVKLGDFDGDGLLDIVTGWEESGVVRLYLNPGADNARQPWPRVTVGTARSPEDAVPFDADGDGRLEIISCHEGKQQQVLVHQLTGPATRSNLLRAANWKTHPIKRLNGQQWMFASSVQFRDGRRGLVIGSKNKRATLTLLSPTTRQTENISNWPHRKLRDSGWIMSIQIIDMDNDGDEDIVFNDRKSKHRCVAWLEQPDERPHTSEWPEHTIGATESESLFIDADPDRVLVTTRHKHYLDIRRTAANRWKSTRIPGPVDVPFGKAIRRLTPDTILFTANTHADAARTKQPGVWLRRTGQGWQPICSTKECKFDRMELLDLDGDGDLDMITCEERQLLGVVWYENPGIR